MTQPKPARSTESRIPTFANREEEAAWWDSHDLGDYQDEFEAVDATFADRLSDDGVDRLARKMA